KRNYGPPWEQSMQLKQFQLLAWGLRSYFFLAVKEFYHSKLFVGYLHNTDLSLFGQVKFSALYMHIRILLTGTKTKINTELKHLKTIVQQFFTENAGSPSLLSGFGR